MSAISREAATLIRAQRWAALATLHEAEPLASMVAYSVDADGALLFHISQLAQHTRDLVEHPRCSLVIGEPDALEGDPQRLQRVTLTGAASVIRRTDAAYLAAQMRFELGDFLLFRFTPEEARYVGGFARAARFSWNDILTSGLT